MSCDIDVKTAEKNNVLMIPIRATKTEGSQKFVDILKADNILERKKVEIGLEGDGGMVEVKSGLQVGEKVVTFIKEAK
jgi:macrolide-specific efflux system membrane fusion protein